MLRNAYLLAKIGADAAENERNFAEILPKIGNYPTDPLPHHDAAHDDERRGGEAHLLRPEARRERAVLCS